MTIKRPFLKLIGGRLPFLILLILFLFFFLFQKALKYDKETFKTRINQQETTKVLSSMKTDLNGDGNIEEVKFSQIREFGKDGSTGLLQIFSGKKLITQKDFNLEWDQGEVEIFDLFNDKTRQIFVSSLVGVHSTIGHLFKLEKKELVPICTLQKEGNRQICEFFSDSNLYMPFTSRDLDGDGIKELIKQKKKNNTLEYVFYKWNGDAYRIIEETEADLFKDAMVRADSIPITPTPVIVREIVEKQCEVTPTIIPSMNNNADEILRLKQEIIRKNQEIAQLNNLVVIYRSLASGPHYCPPGLNYSPF